MIKDEGCNIIASRKGFIGKVIFEQKPERSTAASYAKNRGKVFSGRVKSKYKGSMLGVCLVLLRNIEEAIWLVQGEKRA